MKENYMNEPKRWSTKGQQIKMYITIITITSKNIFEINNEQAIQNTLNYLRETEMYPLI